MEAVEVTSEAIIGSARWTDQKSAWLRLAIVISLGVLALTAVAWLSNGRPAPRLAFNSGHLKGMRRMKPHYVLVGNSMVGTRFHQATLSKALAPKRALVITEPGSMSSRWYLFLKYSIIPSGQRPQRVFFFFRDRELTSPRNRITGKHARRIERAAPIDDPVLIAKLAPPPRQPIEHLRWRLEHLVPIERLHDVAQEHLDDWTLRLSSSFAKEVDPAARRASINSVFALAALGDVPNEGADVELEPDPDFSRVEDSFLPDILALAKEHEIPLGFVRVRGRTQADGIPDAPDLATYLQRLRSYVEGRGALFVDMKAADWETPDMYASTDHLKGSVMRTYTRLFVEKMAYLFE